jgi:hypothetical protein
MAQMAQMAQNLQKFEKFRLLLRVRFGDRDTAAEPRD